jgi:hypothetical protein
MNSYLFIFLQNVKLWGQSFENVYVNLKISKLQKFPCDMCRSATLFGTRNFNPRHCISVLCYSDRVFSYIPRFNQQNTENKIK